MGNFKRFISLLLVIVMVLSLAACGEGDTLQDTTAATGGEAAAVSYSVSVETMGGMAMPGLDVYIYADSTLTDMKQYGQTGEDGTVSFSMPESGEYAIVISGAPKGYEVEPSYAFSGQSARICLNSALVSDKDLSGATLGVGDVMYDFSVTTPAGETVTLSDMLAEKDMVLINFWYTTCTYCVAEFPYMQTAYEQFIDDVGIIALDPLDQSSAVEAFQDTHGLTFPMASCPAAWAAAFGVSGYPTSVIVDRYGVICLVEAGGITSLRPFISMFEHFTADDYEQTLYSALSELVTAVKPTYEMPTSEQIGAVVNSGEISVSYRPETDEDDAEFSWPFIITEKNGEQCIKASNQEIDSSFAILYADVELKAGQAIGMDYLVSSESACDILHVIVNDEAIFSISGVSEEEQWASCYPWVAEEDGVYELALCYIKDGSTNEGDDTAYLKNFRVVDAQEVDTATYLPFYAAMTENDFDYTYVDVVFNERDGYYHVGTADGPLLLANLMGYSQLSEEKTVWDMAYEGMLTIDGHNYYDELVQYCSYASNAALNGYCTVNAELAELLKIVAQIAGFDGTEDEWLKICKYYKAYGTDVQLQDPILGLCPASAYKATLGVGVESNFFYYDRPIIPRGLLAEFIPEVSGVYRVTSHNDSLDGVEGWIFDENHEELYVYAQSERLYNDNNNVSMVYYMEAGKPYYIDIAFWDMYEYGMITYDIEYLGSSYELFRLCSPGFFTYDTDATGDAMYYLIAGGVDVVLGDDGNYYEDLGLDENGNQKYGSLIYCDFIGSSSLFNNAIATVDAYNEDGTLMKDANGDPVKVQGLIDMGGFDFSKSEDDLYILSVLKQFDNDVEAADAHLRELWGADYDGYAEAYQVEDVFAGRYHGTGEDLTEEMRGYLDDIITGGSQETRGCVVVTQRLAELLQMLMEKYTFNNVEHSWTKLCFYYDYLGPEG